MTNSDLFLGGNVIFFNEYFSSGYLYSYFSYLFPAVTVNFFQMGSELRAPSSEYNYLLQYVRMYCTEDVQVATTSTCVCIMHTSMSMYDRAYGILHITSTWYL